MKINNYQVQMAYISPYLFILVSILVSYIYIIISALFTHRKCNYIHQTAVSILIGVIAGAIVVFTTNVFLSSDYLQVIRQIIMLALLPPMLFQDGYNIRKRKFFQNIMYINLYGILGTILQFFILFGIFFAFNNYGLIRTINNELLPLQTWQMLALAGCLCSIDTVVAQKIVNPQRYPKLFSIIFGQSILKDTITVTLYDSIINYVIHKSNKEGGNVSFDADDFGFLLLNFIKVFGGSICIGTICGIITTYLFKRLRFLLDQKGVAEVSMIILTGYLSYILSQWAQFSGVIAMLFCGITLSHFNVYNLTQQGKISAKITTSVLAKMAEGLLFFLLGAFIFGIQFQQQSDQTVLSTFSWTLLIITMVSLLISRLINIYLMTLIGFFIIGKDKWRLNFYQYQIIIVSGMVKGAIPFALILIMPSFNKSLSTACIKNTVITIVFLTSLFLNSIMPKILRNRLNKIDDMIINHKDHPSLYDSLLIQFHKKQAQYQKHQRQSNFGSNKSKISNQQIEQRLQTKRNLQRIALYVRLKSTTQKYWRKCQQGFLKPLLIHDYYNRKQNIKMQKIRLRKQEAEQFWKRFKNQNILDPEDEDNNKFIDVKLIQNDQYSQDEDIKKNKIKQQQNGQLVMFVKKQRHKTNLKQNFRMSKKQKAKSQKIIESQKQKFRRTVKPLLIEDKQKLTDKQQLLKQAEGEKNQQNIKKQQNSKVLTENKKKESNQWIQMQKVQSKPQNIQNSISIRQS